MLRRMSRKIWGTIKSFFKWLDGQETKVRHRAEENEPHVETKMFKDEISRPGKYTLTIQGTMTPGEVYVNDDLRVSVYTVSGDMTVILYLLPGDEVIAKGGHASFRPMQYAT